MTSGNPAMDSCERTIQEYLDSLRIGHVRYEPDGNVPPDFVIDGRIAVEARRLNEHEEVDGGYRGLEITAKPLAAAVVKALANSGSPIDSRSWFVHYSVRRPLPSWKEVEKSLRDAVQEFRHLAADPPREMRLGRFLRLRFHAASQPHPTLLILGSSSDHDAGGFVVAELCRNLELCIREKSRKVAAYLERYPEWWLAFEDRISYGQLDPGDVAQVRQALGPVARFAKVILVNPLQPTRGIELYSAIDAGC
jgi:hypothetical protein